MIIIRMRIAGMEGVSKDVSTNGRSGKCGYGNSQYKWSVLELTAWNLSVWKMPVWKLQAITSTLNYPISLKANCYHHGLFFSTKKLASLPLLWLYVFENDVNLSKNSVLEIFKISDSFMHIMPKVMVHYYVLYFYQFECCTCQENVDDHRLVALNLIICLVARYFDQLDLGDNGSWVEMWQWSSTSRS